MRFKPDPTIFERPQFLQKDIVSRVVELTSLNADIKVEVRDERTSESGVVEFPEGVAGLVRLMNRGLTPVYADILGVTHHSDSFRLDVAFQHVEEPGLRARPYVNAIHTIEGGTHWTGFQTGLTKSVQQALKIAGSARVVNGESLLRGLTAVVSVWVDDPQFEGPTRTKFAYAAIRGTVESIVYQGLKDILVERTRVLDAIEDRSRRGSAVDADTYDLDHSPWSLSDISRPSHRDSVLENDR